MNYEKQYFALIYKRQENPLIFDNKFGVIETHHIQPKSLGGSNEQSNLVNLTDREHYVAHWLLYKMLPNSKEMTTAFKLIADIKHGKRHITSRVYQNLKIKMSDILSERMKKYWENLTPEQYAHACSIHSDIMKEYWINMTDEYYEYWCKQHSYDLSHMSPEQLMQRNEKWLNTLNSKSDEEKARIKELKRQGSIKRWQNMTKEQRIEFGNLYKGDKNYMRNMTDSEKLRFSLAVQEGQSKWKKQIGEEIIKN